VPVAIYNRRLHAFAVATVVVMLVTLSAGALVTSKKAGMAFRDWPTSDGRPMLTYPWFQDFARNWDKFLEHGHRLAGLAIGCWIIVLTGLVGWYERRGWLKGLCVGLLAAVIVQGLLGGFRVWLDDHGLAMVHGFFAACVATLLVSIVTALSRTWIGADELYPRADVAALRPYAIATVFVVLLQYLAGGLIRHHGTGLHEHLGLGILTAIVVVMNAVAAHRTSVLWVRQSAGLLLAVVLLQIGLGAGAWVLKWGFAATGFVAIADSIGQVVVRSLHMLVGVMVFSCSVIHLLRVLRLASIGRSTMNEHPASGALALGGGSR
jgi:cytochrome c oxidase assembly protein subunit 15